MRLPWPANKSGRERVWFSFYQPGEERGVRPRLPQFEAVTLAANHGWTVVDLTRLLPEFLAAHKYRESMFQKPEHFRVGGDLEVRAAALIKQACSREEVDANAVLAVTGLAPRFAFIRVSSLIERVEDGVRGRLLIFFPGEYANNVYRFMDARDGFNYMAVPITSIESFIDP